MAHNLVKLITDDDGMKIDNPQWHFPLNIGGANRILCNGHVFGYGESIAEFKLKTVKRGGLTCEDCKKILKAFKQFKL